MRKFIPLLFILVWSCKTHEKKSLNRNQILVETSMKYKGVPYLYGGKTTKGMDCSGLVYKTFSDLGKNIARPSYEQAKEFQKIKERDIRPGDLIYFKIGKTYRINHTGIVTKVVSKDVILFIHSSSSAGVREDNIYSTYWKPKFYMATRPKL